MQARFQVDDKMREVKNLQKENLIQERLLTEQFQKLRFQRIALIFSVLLLISLLILLITFFRMNKRIRKANATLESQNIALEDAKKQLSQSHLDLQEKEELLRTLINSTPDIICFKDGKGRWLQANEADLELFGLKDVDYRLKTDLDLIEFSPFHRQAFLTCATSDEITWQKRTITRNDEAIETASGEMRVFDVIKVPLFNDENERKGLIVLGRDISVRKMTEKKLEMALQKAEESDRLKTAFLSNMSHEIRTPLNAILGFSKLLDDESLSKTEKVGFIKLIHENGNALLNLIGDIIDLARIESGETLLNLKQSNLSQLFVSIFQTYHQIISKKTKNVTISLNIPEKDTRLMIDIEKIRQILVNLIDNAVKFTENGTIEFGFVLNTNEKNEAETIQIFVKDTGIGIQPEKQGIIFERFTKLNTDNKKLYPGTGLGLSIVRQFVQIMGGTIRLVSQPEQVVKLY